MPPLTAAVKVTVSPTAGFDGLKLKSKVSPTPAGRVVVVVVWVEVVEVGVIDVVVEVLVPRKTSATSVAEPAPAG